ncbi:MAG: replication-relaxation family protein [Chloroflexota bacterium]|nr:replication-relaxation family protein [Chloroflexota bacterium]
MERHHWHDAEEAQRWLQDRSRCSAVLYLLARLPFLDIRILYQLAGQHGPAAMYCSVARLRTAGLIASIQPPVYAPNSPHLWYLTDLGLATLALDLECDPLHLAQRFHLRGSDLLKLVPTLRHLLDTYELLGALAASRPGSPTLLAWERPWRRHYPRPAGRSSGVLTVPAYAALSWNGVAGSYLLLPDAGAIPLRLQQATLARLLLLRRAQDGYLPPLLIATTDRERMRAWERLLHDLVRTHREAPLVSLIARWDDLSRGLADLPVQASELAEADLVRSVPLLPLHPRRPASPLPRIVGDKLAIPARSATESVGRTALVVTPADYRLLEVIGFHPYLTANQLSDVMDSSTKAVQRRLNRLLELGLIRHPGTDEIGEDASEELVELTARGLHVVAARLGLSLARAVRELGLVGGGPDAPIGSRRRLLSTLAHTRGADDIFVRLYRQARARAAVGCDEAMVEWQNAAACSRRHLRPDGYGMYRCGSRYDGFFLEYDRGTMNARDYFKKFRAYYRYGVTGRFERDYNSYPTVLVVTSDNAAEERIARVARATAVGQPGELPVLLTCQWRIDDVTNSDGLLNPIWREPNSDLDNRRHWVRIPHSSVKHRMP